jgi:hypothetical protein
VAEAVLPIRQQYEVALVRGEGDLLPKSAVDSALDLVSILKCEGQVKNADFRDHANRGTRTNCDFELPELQALDKLLLISELPVRIDLPRDGAVRRPFDTGYELLAICLQERLSRGGMAEAKRER